MALEDDASSSPRMGAGRALWQPVGRVLLWCAVGLVLIRGVTSIVAPPRDEAPSASGAQVAAAGQWPDEEARAFAVRFARSYLTWSPRHPEYHERALAAMLAPELRSDAAVDVPDRGRDQAVDEAVVARVERLGTDRALITVSCVVYGDAVTTRYVVVPVARDGRAGLAVFDYPAFTSGPRLAAVSTQEDGDALTGPDADAIEGLLRRFFPVYLSGGELSYFLAAGARVEPVAQRYEALDLVSVAQEGPELARERRVLAVVTARDVESGAVYTLRYRLALQRGDRWLVQGVEG